MELISVKDGDSCVVITYRSGYVQCKQTHVNLIHLCLLRSFTGADLGGMLGALQIETLQ
jgi:hypothetical protein